MTTNALPTISRSDAELVAASRGGNREAFGQIVRKYQGMVSGLIYAACGDVHRSEDLAQETFISAWKSLSGLRDPAKLAGWLCQIARHRVADLFREKVTHKVRLQEEFDAREATGVQPVDQAMTAEENEILWRTLSRIPQPYRETMVLYYRHGRSTAEVAAAMETTDEAVRQRLQRGRSMLREELAGMVERGLASSAPGPEFSLAVMASLPMTAGPAAGLAVTAKGSGFLFSLTAWVPPLLAVLSMAVITGQSIYRAKAGRHKQFVIAYWIVFWLSIATWVYLSNLLVMYGRRHHWEYPVFVPVISTAWCLFAMVLFSLTALSGSQFVVRREPQRPQLLQGFWARFIFITPLIYLGVGWMAHLAFRAGDRLSAELIVAAALIGSAICAARKPKDGKCDSIQMTFESWLWIEVIVLVALNCRLLSWMVVVDHMTLTDLKQQIPFWSINGAGAVLFVWMLTLVQWNKRHRQIT